MSDAYHFAVIAGGVARSARHASTTNPHRRGSLLAKCWRCGWLRAGGDETISREMKAPGQAARTPRSEWTEAELGELDELAGLPSKLIAEILERSAVAVRVQQSRRRAKARAA